MVLFYGINVSKSLPEDRLNRRSRNNKADGIIEALLIFKSAKKENNAESGGQ